MSKQELERYKYFLCELLAIIHSDGGHYHAEHGVEKATEDAIGIISKLRVEVAELKYTIKCMKRDCNIVTGEDAKKFNHIPDLW